jgi:hypothetical protein
MQRRSGRNRCHRRRRPGARGRGTALGLRRRLLRRRLAAAVATIPARIELGVVELAGQSKSADAAPQEE